MYRKSQFHKSELKATVTGIFAAGVFFTALPFLHAFISDQNGPNEYPIDIIHDRPDTFIEPDEPIEEPKDEEEEEPILDEPPEDIVIENIDILFLPPKPGGTIDTRLPYAEKESLDDLLDAYQLSELDNKPEAISMVTPHYPFSLRKENGKVVVEFIITAKGKVSRAKVISSTNHGFDSAALDAVRRSKWSPGEKNGKAVASIVRLPVLFEGK